MAGRLLLAAALAGTIAGTASGGAYAAPRSLKLETSFRIGDAGVLCTAESLGVAPLLSSMFDRGYAMVCRDAASRVGQLWALHSGAGAAAPAVLAARGGGSCAPAAMMNSGGIENVARAQCDGAEDGVPRLVLSVERGGVLYIAEGLSSYESALALGLQSMVLDRPVPGAVVATTTGLSDPAALARVQAGILDPEAALSEGYLRNNAGSFAEAAAFFDVLIERGRTGDAGFARTAEYLANQGLQQSNLGNRAVALDLFARATRAPDAIEPVQQRRLRNFRAIDSLNNQQPDAALAILAAPISATSEGGLQKIDLEAGVIERPVAQRLNTDAGRISRLAGGEQRLSDSERTRIMDAQALYLTGVAERTRGELGAARIALTSAIEGINNIRGGRVKSLGWLNAASYTDLALISEAQGDMAAARSQFEEAVRLMQAEYPGSATLLAAQARLAAFLLRRDDVAGARALYADVVKNAPSTPGGDQAIRPLIGPYFALLASAGTPADVAEFFMASQTLVRPGVAQTQAALARELSGGSDAASALFREVSSVSREVVQVEGEIAALSAQRELTADEQQTLEALGPRRQMLATQQTKLIDQLSAFPRYRVVAPDTVKLEDLQAALVPGEAYYKLALVGEQPYALMIGKNSARITAIAATVADLQLIVARLRDSIVRIEDGRTATYPFEAQTSRTLYKLLFAGLDEEVANTRHMIFEPDGPLLQLPPNLLIMDDKGLAAYQARVADITADAYDMRGISWLGRDRMLTTAVSPRSFIDLRAIAPSRATQAYLGMGGTARPGAAMSMIPRDACDWPLASWNNPVAVTELQVAAKALGGSGTELLIGSAFSDTNLAARTDLNNYRILHFATHGLVTAPAPQCAARPALLTSFGGQGSDGLLSFSEIFDLRLDAETVILSACDTAGMATVSATREAGISTGGNFALDGLVRAFVGAGSRSVVASHWPVPDDYDATGQLISGLFKGKPGEGVGESMRQAALGLMNKAETSHPYYWAAFAIVGDGARPLQ